MTVLTREDFRSLLRDALVRTRELAQREVADPLPADSLLILDAFGRGRQESSCDEIVPYLYRDGTFPREVVVGVRGIVDGRTALVLAPTGHPYVDDLRRSLNQPPGMGPFNCVGLMVRAFVAARPRPLSRQDLEDAAALWRRVRSG